MDDLQPLVRLVSRNKLKQVDVLHGSASGKLRALYEGVRTGAWPDEEAAAEALYPGSPRQRQYFQRLKRKLKERLIDNLFLIDLNQPQYTDYQRALYGAYRNLAAAKILIGRYQRGSAVPLLERTLARARRYDFTEVALEISKELRLHYGTLVGNRKKFQEYNALCKKLSATYQAELMAEEYYIDLAIHFSRSKATKPEVLAKARGYTERLRSQLSAHRSYRLHFLSYLVFSLRYEIANDYPATLGVCQEALAYFNRRRGLASNAAKFTFLLKSLNCHIHLKAYGKGKVAVDKCLKLLPPGSNNWFLTLDYHMILCFHAGQWKKAYETYALAAGHANFGKQAPALQEHWKVHEAFLAYFLSIGKIALPAGVSPPSFRVGKFLNEVPTFSKDKRGINITIIILHILWLLQRKRFGDIVDKIESLKAYDQRYLRRDETFRSSCFIKMLLLLPTNNFHQTAVERKAEKYLAKLRAAPSEIGGRSSEVEIVPYELLWKYTVEGLERKFQRV